MCVCSGWKGCAVHKSVYTLMLIGGLNWGLVGLGMLLGSNWNVVYLLLGSMPVVEAVVYLLVGVAAIMSIFGCKCKKCMDACKSCVAGGDNMGGQM